MQVLPVVLLGVAVEVPNPLLLLSGVSLVRVAATSFNVLATESTRSRVLVKPKDGTE